MTQLLAWARGEFSLARAMKDGRTYRDHLESVVRQTGGRVVPEELRNAVERPMRTDYLWGYFTRLSRRRIYDGFSGIPQRISSAEMLAWATLNRVPLQTIEVEILERLDDVFVEVALENMAANRKREETEQRAKKASNERTPSN